MKIYAPVKDFNGWRNTVRFVNGVGETTDQQLIHWFKTHGYKVPIEENPRVERASTIQTEDLLTQLVEDAETVNQPDFDAMTPIELREWMKENGYSGSIKNIRNKEKLLEIIRG